MLCRFGKQNSLEYLKVAMVADVYNVCLSAVITHGEPNKHIQRKKYCSISSSKKQQRKRKKKKKRVIKEEEEEEEEEEGKQKGEHRYRHASKLGIVSEEALEGDAGLRHAVLPNLHLLLRLYSLQTPKKANWFCNFIPSVYHCTCVTSLLLLT